MSRLPWIFRGVPLKVNGDTCQCYLGYFRESHWKSMVYLSRVPWLFPGVPLKVNGDTCQGYPGYFREPHWKSMVYLSRVPWLFPGVPLKVNGYTCQGYPGYFREPHSKSMGLLEISRVTLTGMSKCQDTIPCDQSVKPGTTSNDDWVLYETIRYVTLIELLYWNSIIQFSSLDLTQVSDASRLNLLRGDF